MKIEINWKCEDIITALSEEEKSAILYKTMGAIVDCCMFGLSEGNADFELFVEADEATTYIQTDWTIDENFEI